MMKISGTLPNLVLTEKNCFANTGCIQHATGYSNTETYFFSVPTNIYNDPDPDRASGSNTDIHFFSVLLNIHNDPDPDRASGSFLFFGRDKKYFSNSDNSSIHREAVVKNITEQKNHNHPFNPDHRA